MSMSDSQSMEQVMARSAAFSAMTAVASIGAVDDIRELVRKGSEN
jgi:hypothetical protein